MLASAGPLPGEVVFERIEIESEYKAEACAAADLNDDGRPDIIAGENWYGAPDWKPNRFRDIDTNVAGSGYADVRLDVPFDIDGDGQLDILTVRREKELGWLKNPGNEGQWEFFPVGFSPLTEGVVIADVLNDARPEFIVPFGDKGQGVSCWSAPPDPSGSWVLLPIGTQGGAAHGLGVGDMDRNGRPDILTQGGWYRSPGNAVAGGWAFSGMDRDQTHHPVVYDIDGDGDQDVAAGAPHDYGLWWWEQRTDDQARVSWRRHEIDKSLSQMHALVPADVDGDGDADLVSGKRYLAHGGNDPGVKDPALLVWYELIRSEGEVRFVRHTVDDDSGVGYVVTPTDIDKDGDIDIVTSNKKGVFLFRQKGEPRFAPLFNGEDLSNWEGDEEVWRVEHGAIIGETKTGLKHNNFLLSKESYGDFVLTLEVRLEPDTANSGIQFRSAPAGHGEVRGYQADIGKGWWGSIYEELGRGLLHDGYKERGARTVVPGQWNRYVLYAMGDELRVEINGTVCTAIRDTESARGIFALQVHSGGPTRVEFRNIRLRLLP
jgi:hypothetical protein